jgi:glyceraldehyde 3-phosphate dehydrogenase
MSKRIAINGFGRIGRSVFRILAERDDMTVVAINDIFRPEQLAYLLEYDSVMGRFERPVTWRPGFLTVDGRDIQLTAVRDPAELPWKKLGIDLVIESTGIFRDRATLQKHLDAGAQRVLLTVPPKDDIDAMVVMGVNDHLLAPKHRLISNASCTTNCLAPLAKVLNDTFGIKRGIMTTVHAYTNDQRLADVPHKDLRRSRAAAENIIPTETGAARAVGKVLPELKGRLDGIAARVPVADGSVVDLVVQLDKKASRDEINGPSAKRRTARSRRSSSTPTCRWSPATSSVTRTPRCSTAWSPRARPTASRACCRGTTTSGATRTAAST